MCENLYDFATQKAAIAGGFEQNYELNSLPSEKVQLMETVWFYGQVCPWLASGKWN